MSHPNRWHELPTGYLHYWRARAITLYKQDIALKKKTKGVLVASGKGASIIRTIDNELKRRGDWA